MYNGPYWSLVTGFSLGVSSLSTYTSFEELGVHVLSAFLLHILLAVDLAHDVGFTSFLTFNADATFVSLGALHVALHAATSSGVQIPALTNSEQVLGEQHVTLHSLGSHCVSDCAPTMVTKKNINTSGLIN